MNKLLRPFLLLPAVFLLSGCVIAVDTDRFDDDDDGNWQREQRQNREAIEDLRLGLEQDDVEFEMGEPAFRDTFLREGSEFVVLYYRTQRRHGDGETTRDETTPLVFVDGELVGWGDSAVEYATADR